MGHFREFLNESNKITDWLGRKLNISTTNGKPNLESAPKWAKYLGKLPNGSYHWLSNKTAVETPDSDAYFPDAKKVEFTGYVGKSDNKPSIEKIRN